MGCQGCSLRKPSTWHAVLAVFLQFFAWGLITAPMIKILNVSFGKNAMLLNGIIMGVKGFLSFLSAPLIGALSDVYGRKIFLLLTAFFTCVPIPFIKIDEIGYYVLMSTSGIFCIIFSVAFAYVADVTDEASRSLGYGLVTAGFAASLILSPALGAGLELLTGSDTVVVILATVVALVDVLFIIVVVPESLPPEQKTGLKSLTLKQVDPFSSLRGIWSDKKVLLMVLVSVMSYLPEAGQATCFFVYLTLVLDFSPMNVGFFICYVGVLSTICQTAILSNLIRYIGPKKTIIVGLTAQLIELLWYGLGSQVWGVWAAGVFISLSSITYAAISAYLSLDTAKDKQGAVQGTLMGARGLCNGLGPAAFGLLFYLFGIDIAGESTEAATNATAALANSTLAVIDATAGIVHLGTNTTHPGHLEENSVMAVMVSRFPGIPFLIMSVCVACALIASFFLENITKGMDSHCDTTEPRGSNSQSENSETKVDIKSSSLPEITITDISDTHLEGGDEGLTAG